MTQRFQMLTFLIVLGFTTLAQAQSFTTLYSFTGGSDGAYPFGGVIQDPSGNLYGTTVNGGQSDCGGIGCGVVYKLDTTGTETVLHSFSGPDGADSVTPLIRDKAGNLYGTTNQGGSIGFGNVFKIDTAGNETVLYSFTGGSDGCEPDQGLVMGPSGTLFGTTTGYPCGTYGNIFKVNSAGKFAVLHQFGGADGEHPSGGSLTMDKSGNIYGTAWGGGDFNFGVVYRVDKGRRLTVLYSFSGHSDGSVPMGRVKLDADGNLYGTTAYGGYHNNGTIWKVSKDGVETVLHKFTGGSADGCNPSAGVTRDSKGNLYGVTPYCGANDGGVLYKLRAKGKLILLHSFGPDSEYPFDEVVRTASGTLFGTTNGKLTPMGGGTSSYGTVWKYVP